MKEILRLAFMLCTSTLLAAPPPAQYSINGVTFGAWKSNLLARFAIRPEAVQRSALGLETIRVIVTKTNIIDNRVTAPKASTAPASHATRDDLFATPEPDTPVGTEIKTLYTLTIHLNASGRVVAMHVRYDDLSNDDVAALFADLDVKYPRRV